MNWKRVGEDVVKAVIGYATVALIGIIVAAIKRHELALLASSGGLWHLLISGIPLWVFVLVVTIAGWLFLKLRSFGWPKKPVLHVVWEPGQNWWHQGTVSGRPAMQVGASALFSLANDQFSLILTKAYFRGTQCVVGFIEPITVKPRVALRMNIHVFLQPVIAEAGQAFKGKLIFVDQFNRKHETDEATFMPR
ncbi:MAG TPA: hypothetical protein VNM47_14430 [Terriglobia bacterium]|nr:hypothetical protein [Terriglobia bacterium]